LGSRLATVRGSENIILTFGNFFKILYQATSKQFRVFKDIFHVRWINIDSVKLIVILKYVSRVVFKGGILGGARQFWGNPYLNSTIVLFDTIIPLALKLIK